MLLNPVSNRDVFEVDEAEQVAKDWWLFLLAGLISLVFGALILSIDWSVDGLAAFIGTLFIIQGAAWAITRPLDGGTRSTNIIAGLAGAGLRDAPGDRVGGLARRLPDGQGLPGVRARPRRHRRTGPVTTAVAAA